jgi:glycosyltransferase involved in cell wall biosynthesis
MDSSKKNMSSKYVRHVWCCIQTRLFPPAPLTGPLRVCVITPRFPGLGGVRTVLEEITQVTQGLWEIEYLAQELGPQREKYIIHRFGARHVTAQHFPLCWLYVLLGIIKLLFLIRRGARYHLLLPQDGLFNAVLAGLVGKVTGTRVICIDHANISLFTPRNNSIYRKERVAAISSKDWPWLIRFAMTRTLTLYWPSRRLAASLAARLVDQYFIPGVPGDNSEEGCKIIGLPLDHVTRFRNMIDLDQYPLLDEATYLSQREGKGLSRDAIVIALVSRLAPEKRIDIAFECLSRILLVLNPGRRERLRVVIAGDGPLREALEQDMRRRGLQHNCFFFGELRQNEAHLLLGVSDIFLYTSTRGAGMPLGVLEAMASRCAVIASTEPLANALLLADGRGISVPPGDVEQTSSALLRLITDVSLCRHMGKLARDYVSTHHSPAQFKHALLQVTGKREGPVVR